MTKGLFRRGERREPHPTGRRGPLPSRRAVTSHVPLLMRETEGGAELPLSPNFGLLIPAPFSPFAPISLSSQAKATRIIAQELKRLRWKAEDPRSRRKGDPEKVRLARR